MSFAHEVPAADACFRLAMAASGIGMAIVDLDGCWRQINPVIERMFGYQTSELLGQPITALLHAEQSLPGLQTEIAALVGGSVGLIDARYRCVHRDSADLWIQANIAVMRSPAGVPHYLVAQLRDVTTERAAEELLRQMDAERTVALDAVNRELQLLVDAVSHDLRAPLRSIESFAGLLAQRIQGSVDETSLDYLGRVRSAAARMSNLLTALAELSQVTRATLKPADVDISLLAEWALAELREAEPERLCDIEVQAELTAHGDERLLKLLLGHLLGNAWKFSAGCERVHIRVNGESDANGALKLRVLDTGCGFDMRYAHKLFEPFQRLHGPDQGGGHGLGLAVAQRIASRHNGRLSGHSCEEGGSSFELELPGDSRDHLEP
ncbi:MAG: ATP-binding protein [Pseudomonadota bacterium]|nr:ATP-binding protein [Pseudomonadota bacterium]